MLGWRVAGAEDGGSGPSRSGGDAVGAVEQGSKGAAEGGRSGGRRLQGGSKWRRTMGEAAPGRQQVEAHHGGGAMARRTRWRWEARSFSIGGEKESQGGSQGEVAWPLVEKRKKGENRLGKRAVVLHSV